MIFSLIKKAKRKKLPCDFDETWNEDYDSLIRFCNKCGSRQVKLETPHDYELVESYCKELKRNTFSEFL